MLIFFEPNFQFVLSIADDKVVYAEAMKKLGEQLGQYPEHIRYKTLNSSK